MLFVEVTQTHISREVYLRNAIWVTEIFCYQYLTINNSVIKQHFSTKLGPSQKFCVDLAHKIVFEFVHI